MAHECESDRDARDRCAVEPMDPQIRCIQPGSGVCFRIELLWGHLRRAILKTCFPGYVRRMAASRQGEPVGCPHEVLDPRDLKFYENITGRLWRPEDDPFQWRDQLPFAREGLAELVLMGGGLLVLGAVLALAWNFWIGLPALVLGLFVFSFFRNPRRVPPVDPHVLVSPADGKIVTIERIEHDEFVGGPAVLVGIFLSVFNVHINRVPNHVRVIGLTYRPGKFLNALLPRSAQENERLELRLEDHEDPRRRYRVRQIAGAIARRIVCRAAPGNDYARGQSFGMIKLGSRTELVIPDLPNLTLEVRVGDHVKAGSTKVARYVTPS